MKTHKIKGSHPYELGINLFDLQKILFLKSVTAPPDWNKSVITSLRPDPEKETIDVDFEIGRSKVHYTFYKESFDYEMQDISGGPLEYPERAKRWTLENALDWITQAGRRDERPITTENLPRDVEWFVQQFAKAMNRPPTPDEIAQAYSMCPVQKYERGITEKQAREAYKQIGGE